MFWGNKNKKNYGRRAGKFGFFYGIRETTLQPDNASFGFFYPLINSGIEQFRFGNPAGVGLNGRFSRFSFASDSKGRLAASNAKCSDYPGRNELKNFSNILNLSP